MADTKEIFIETADLAGTDLTVGGDAPRVVKRDGLYALEILTAEAGESEKGNKTLRLKFKILDTDEEGGVLYRNMAVTGSYPRGEETISSMRENLGKLLISAGLRTKEQVEEMVRAKKVSLTAIAAELTGKTCFAGVRTKDEEDQKGETRPKSEPKFWVAKAQYDRAVGTRIGYRMAERGAAAAAPTKIGTNSKAAPGTVAVDDISARV